MNEVEQKTLEFARDNMSCSQMVYLLSKEYHNLGDNNLLKALDGLSGGMHIRGVCGAFSGACCVMSLYLGKSGNTARDEKLAPCIEELDIWFKETHKSILCCELVEYGKEDFKKVCLNIVSSTFMKTMEILSENGIDLYDI